MGHTSRILLSLLLICAHASRGPFAGDAPRPAVVWCSAPAGPGEIAMVHGAGWLGDAAVLLAVEATGEPGLRAAASPAVASSHRLRPVSVTSTCVSSMVPKNLPPASYRCRIESRGQDL